MHERWVGCVTGVILALGAMSCRGRADPRAREALPRGDAAAEGIDGSALERLVATARAEHSEALVVVKNGKVIHENYFGFADEPIVAMSASKSFVGLAFGFLVAEGKVALDDRVASTHAAFATDPWKARITYRHLLSQTSGLDPKRASLDPRPDIERRANESHCVFEPGTSFQYSNGGVDFLAVLIGELAGKPMDAYLDEKLFRRIGISGVTWKKDVRGVPFGAGEMSIRAVDLAKVGAVLVDEGKWKGVPIISPAWIAAQSSVSNPYEPLYGLSWWRIGSVQSVALTPDLVRAWRTAAVPEATLTKLAPLVGRPFADVALLQAAERELVTEEEASELRARLAKGDHLPQSRPTSIGPVVGYSAAGWLGQYLVVIPDKRLVAVRMRRPRASDYAPGTSEVYAYRSFPRDIPTLAR